MEKLRKNVTAVVLFIGVILIWDGIVGLVNIYLFPTEPTLRYVLVLILGLMILYLHDHDFDELSRNRSNNDENKNA